MDFDFTEEQEMLRNEMQRFCKKELSREYVRWMDENCDFVPEELWKKITEIGYFGVNVPEEYGGQGLGSIDAMIMNEELATASVAVLLSVGVTGLGSSVILNMGTPEQKEKYLPRLAKGNSGSPWGSPNRAAGPTSSGRSRPRQWTRGITGD